MEPVIAQRSARFFRFFSKYAVGFLRRNFHEVHLLGSVPKISGPTIICGNHPGWHDPMMMLAMCHTLFPHHQHYAPIDSDALEGYGFFKKLGFFGVDAQSMVGARAFVRTANAILQQPNAILWITAQGEFTDVRKRPVKIRPGLEMVARQFKGDLTVLPLVVEYTFTTEKKPDAFAHFGTAIEEGESWTTSCERALEQSQDHL
ncbi:MAG: lysophospholipid acyltransferase family protein, partial [Verrucomicrobiota bacterium]